MVNAHHNGHQPTEAPWDEPPWSPSLIEAIHEQGRCYLVANVNDADRMMAYGLLTLAVSDIHLLTADLLHHVKVIEVLQRPREDDTHFGVAVKRRLLDIGWAGDFNRGCLVEVQADTSVVERDCHGDKDLFATTILGAFDPMLLERLRPPHRERQAKKARPVVVTMSDVEAQPIEWLWWPYIAIGKLCMLDGDPGIGKTLLMTRLATGLSLGQPLPDQQGQPTLPTDGPQTTLLLSTEDGLADTLKPRLEAAGADCSKIHVLTGWRGAEDEVHVFTLQHMDVLKAAMQQYRPRLLVIDPIQAYLGPIDMHRANETRPLLAALARLAEQYRCAIVCIRHPGKPGQGESKVIHRGLGSIDFIGAARTALFVEQHPTEPEKALMAQSKSNIGPLGRTQVYTKQDGVFRWCSVSRLTAELMAGSGRGPDRYAFLEVVCWLEKHLKPGIPQASTDVEAKLAEEGCRQDTIKRAKKALGILSFRAEDKWYWKLPALPLRSPPTTSSTSSTSSPSVKSIGYSQGGQEVEGDEVVEEDEVAGVVLGGENGSQVPDNSTGETIKTRTEARRRQAQPSRWAGTVNQLSTMSTPRTLALRLRRALIGVYATSMKKLSLTYYTQNLSRRFTTPS